MSNTGNDILIGFDKVCRLCLSRKRAVSSVFDDNGISFNLKDRIFAYIGIEVSLNDGLPTVICSNCRNQINAWHKFKEHCKQCDDVLHKSITRNERSCSDAVTLQKIKVQNLVNTDSHTQKVQDPDTEKRDTAEKIMVIKVESAFHGSNTHIETDLEQNCVVDSIENLTVSLFSNDSDNLLTHDNVDGGFSEDEDVIDHEKNTKFSKDKQSLECKTYGCTKCGKTFIYTSNFTFHMCSFGTEKRYVCNVCGKDYSTIGAVKTHLHIHKGKHKCVTCGKSFPSKFQVEVHMRIHTGEKPYVCEYCGKRFAYDKGLALHMSVHTGIKPYKCDECNYSTISRSYIKNHKSVHRAEKPYVCEICGQGYTLLPSLLNHQLNHSDQKTYVCEICNKAFNTSRKLASHKIMHSGIRPYHCEQCGKQFARKEGLKEHRVIHTGEKNFVCLVCKKHFAWRKILRTHKCSGASDLNT